MSTSNFPFHNYTVDLYKISLFLGDAYFNYNGKKGGAYTEFQMENVSLLRSTNEEINCGRVYM